MYMCVWMFLLVPQINTGRDLINPGTDHVVQSLGPHRTVSHVIREVAGSHGHADGVDTAVFIGHTHSQRHGGQVSGVGHVQPVSAQSALQSQHRDLRSRVVDVNHSGGHLLEKKGDSSQSRHTDHRKRGETIHSPSSDT